MEWIVSEHFLALSDSPLWRVAVLGAAATEIRNHNNVKKQCGAWSVYSTQLSPISGKLNWLQYSQGKEVHRPAAFLLKPKFNL